MILDKDQDGIALVTALILSLVGLILVMAITRMLSTSTYFSGSVKRYTSSLEASKGGVEEFISSLKNSTWFDPSDANWLSGHTCKLRRDSSLWSSVCSFCSSCDCYSNSNPDDIINCPDWQKNYGSYTVYAKIIDCKGYADGFLYNIEVVGVGSSSEKAWIAVLYQQSF
jgi:Tfp pilus assembly protein PilX